VRDERQAGGGEEDAGRAVVEAPPAHPDAPADAAWPTSQSTL
jgi:hypothetical protein